MYAEVILYICIFIFWIWENTIVDRAIVYSSIDNLGDHCPICLGDFTFENPDYLLKECEKKGRLHCFHKECINKLLKNSNKCPLCREIIIKPRKDYNICRYSRLVRHGVIG
tara:strand:- start:4126 stop:4458 length:333 start_codon:yes stop_codon:yes gene_type:complete